MGMPKEGLGIISFSGCYSWKRKYALPMSTPHALCASCTKDSKGWSTWSI